MFSCFRSPDIDDEDQEIGKQTTLLITVFFMNTDDSEPNDEMKNVIVERDIDGRKASLVLRQQRNMEPDIKIVHEEKKR